MALFVVSFLVLFLETAVIRWMPAYVRLLAYFSNFILLASFLGIGLGCLLATRKRNLTRWFPLVLLALIVAVDRLRLEVALPPSSTIYFSSGTAAPVVAVESTLLLPLLFAAVAALFVTVAYEMGRQLTAHAPLGAYIINLLGSLTGVAAFALVSWLQLPPLVWFGVAAAAALPFVATGRRVVAVANIALLAASLVVVHRLERGSLWSPYYRITVFQDREDTVVEVNHIFHQSMAPVAHKEYFYQWPYAVFGDTFRDVLILGAGTGTDVAAALAHGAAHVDAVDIDPVILRLGAEHHPDRPYRDPRVTIVNDDARHFLRTTTKKYDLIVFALIDSLTVQSSFSGVRLESYMFTAESFEAVRDHLTPRGVMALYNYFREKWLVDRLANTVARAFGEPLGHVHQDRAYLAVMLAGPRIAELKAAPPLPADVSAYGQPHAPSPARRLVRDASVAPATDDWPFLYMRTRELPRHYQAALALVLGLSSAAVLLARARDRATSWSWHFFFLGAGFMLLETKSIVQFALLWGSTWSSASLAIASVLTMALASAVVASRIEIRRRGVVAAALLALVAINYLVPVGRVPFSSRALESMFYGALVFSPVFCAGLLFSASFRESSSTATDFGANLLGAIVGGVGEYVSLLAGYRFLLILVGVSYLVAIRTADRGLRIADWGLPLRAAGGFDRCDGDAHELVRLVDEGGYCIYRHGSGFDENLQPIHGLVAFFLDGRHFRHEIGSRFCPAGRAVIRADRGRASRQLQGDVRGDRIGRERADKSERVGGERLGSLLELVGRHTELRKQRRRQSARIGNPRYSPFCSSRIDRILPHSIDLTRHNLRS